MMGILSRGEEPECQNERREDRKSHIPPLSLSLSLSEKEKEKKN